MSEGKKRTPGEARLAGEDQQGASRQKDRATLFPPPKLHDRRPRKRQRQDGACITPHSSATEWQKSGLSAHPQGVLHHTTPAVPLPLPAAECTCERRVRVDVGRQPDAGAILVDRQLVQARGGAGGLQPRQQRRHRRRHGCDGLLRVHIPGQVPASLIVVFVLSATISRAARALRAVLVTAATSLAVRNVALLHWNREEGRALQERLSYQGPLHGTRKTSAPELEAKVLHTPPRQRLPGPGVHSVQQLLRAIFMSAQRCEAAAPHSILCCVTDLLLRVGYEVGDEFQARHTALLARPADMHMLRLRHLRGQQREACHCLCDLTSHSGGLHAGPTPAPTLLLRFSAAYFAVSTRSPRALQGCACTAASAAAAVESVSKLAKT
jgi:hypothetical protein